MTQTETEYGPPAPDESTFYYFECKICHEKFEKAKEITAWEIHKLNHTLVSLKNIIDRASGGRLY